jgi:hypothetical protein
MPPAFSIAVGDRKSCPDLKASAYADPGEAERERAEGMFGCVVSIGVKPSCAG